MIRTGLGAGFSQVSAAGLENSSYAFHSPISTRNTYSLDAAMLDSFVRRLPCFPVVIYTILGIPIAFWGWYLSIYDSAKSESTLGYIKFFIFFLVNIGFCIYAAIAPQFSAASWSFAGWMTAFSALNVS
jgi:hypothetical protein